MAKRVEEPDPKDEDEEEDNTARGPGLSSWI
jgi:hypothetical protein